MDSVAINVDNMEFMATVADRWFDLAIVDPQTGQNEGKNHTTRSVRGVTQENGNVLKVNNPHRISEWDNKPPEQTYYDELFRVSKHQIIMCENYLDFAQKKTSAGRIVWNLLRDNDFSACQIMWTSLFQKIEYFEFIWNGMIQGYKINSRDQQGNKQLNERRIHPSQKPVAVYGHLLQKYAGGGYEDI